MKDAFLNKGEQGVIEVDLTDAKPAQVEVTPTKVKIREGLYLEHKQFNKTGRWYVGFRKCNPSGFDTWINVTDCIRGA